jgi:hypothetical protein
MRSNEGNFSEKYKELANILSQCKQVTKYDEGDNKEAWTMSHAFIDLETSFSKFSDELLPKLLNKNLSEKEIQKILIDIGEEFRHILYHIKDPKFYNYLNISEKTDNQKKVKE